MNGIFRFWPIASFALVTLLSGGIAWGTIQSQVESLVQRQDRFEAITKEQLNDLRLGVNRIDDRTRDQFKAVTEVLFEIKGKLEK